jgi:hypothetical protein
MAREEGPPIMVSAVGSIPNPQYRTGTLGARPLPVRFAELRARATKEIPEHDAIGRQALSLYESESNFDLLYQAIEDSKRRCAAPTVPPSPAQERAEEEHRALRDQYNRAVHELAKAQSWLFAARDNWIHAILGDIPVDAFVTLDPMPTAVGTYRFGNAQEAKKAAADLLQRVQWVNEIVAQVRAAQSLDVQPSGDIALKLVYHLTRTRTQTQERLASLETK